MSHDSLLLNQLYKGKVTNVLFNKLHFLADTTIEVDPNVSEHFWITGTKILYLKRTFKRMGVQVTREGYLAYQIPMDKLSYVKEMFNDPHEGYFSYTDLMVLRHVRKIDQKMAKIFKMELPKTAYQLFTQDMSTEKAAAAVAWVNDSKKRQEYIEKSKVETQKFYRNLEARKVRFANSVEIYSSGKKTLTPAQQAYVNLEGLSAYYNIFENPSEKSSEKTLESALDKLQAKLFVHEGLLRQNWQLEEKIKELEMKLATVKDAVSN